VCPLLLLLCCCSALLLVLLPFLLCSVRSLQLWLAAATGLFCFLHCGSNLRPALLSHWWSLLSCLDAGLRMRSRRALIHCYLKSCCHCALAYRLHSAEHSPPSSLCTLLATKSRPLLYRISPWREKRSSAGTENQELVCLWVKGGARLRSAISFTVSSSLVYWLQP
jgi:hypothetical protein